MKPKKLEPAQKTTADTTTDADKTEEEVEAAETVCFVHFVARMDIPLRSATRSNGRIKKTSKRKAD